MKINGFSFLPDALHDAGGIRLGTAWNFRVSFPEQGCKCNIFCFFFPTFACREDGLCLDIAQAKKRGRFRIGFTPRTRCGKALDK